MCNLAWENLWVTGKKPNILLKALPFQFLLMFPITEHTRLTLIIWTITAWNTLIISISWLLSDAKSKDLLTTKQDEAEWAEYQKVMGDVIKRSGLKINNFFDLRGNHDTYGASISGSFDFYSKYSINAQLRRTGLVNSVRLQVSHSPVSVAVRHIEACKMLMMIKKNLKKKFNKKNISAVTRFPWHFLAANMAPLFLYAPIPF